MPGVRGEIGRRSPGKGDATARKRLAFGCTVDARSHVGDDGDPTRRVEREHHAEHEEHRKREQVDIPPVEPRLRGELDGNQRIMHSLVDGVQIQRVFLGFVLVLVLVLSLIVGFLLLDDNL
eukprot:3051997-Rhodomonas_salina.1